MKLKNIFISFLAGACFLAFSSTAFAVEQEQILIKEMPITETVKEFSDLPLLEGQFQSEPNQEQIDEINAERDPIFQSIENREITPEGYLRVYARPSFSATRKNDKYELLGSVSVYNSQSVTGQLAYSQANSKTVNWSVSGNVSAKGDIQIPFLAGLEGSFGVTVARSVATSRSSTVTYSTPVPPRTSVTIECYQTALYGAGTMAWWDYRPSGGAPVRSGNISVSGSAPIVNGYHYQVR